MCFSNRRMYKSVMGRGEKRCGDFTAIPAIQVKPFTKKPLTIFVRY